MKIKKIPRKFYEQDTITVAKALLGTYLVHIVDGTEIIGRIVEVEAYVGSHDLASHSSRGVTPRTKTMFGPPGFAYVYLIYGVYHCMNVVTEKEGNAAAVLIRAVEPVANITGKTNGPGLLAKAMQIDRSNNGHDLMSDDFYIAKPARIQAITIVERPRIGVDYAGDWTHKDFRFYIKGNPFISRK